MGRPFDVRTPLPIRPVHARTTVQITRGEVAVLSPQQGAALQVIVEEYRRTGLPPTHREIASRLRMSCANVGRLIGALRRKGALRIEHGKARAYAPRAKAIFIRFPTAVQREQQEAHAFSKARSA